MAPSSQWAGPPAHLPGQETHLAHHTPLEKNEQIEKQLLTASHSSTPSLVGAPAFLLPFPSPYPFPLTHSISEDVDSTGEGNQVVELLKVSSCLKQTDENGHCGDEQHGTCVRRREGEREREEGEVEGEREEERGRRGGGKERRTERRG